MKLTVLNWLKDSSISLIGRTIELIFRTLLFFLPLGAYLILIQLREKASAVSSLSTFTNDESRWQHVFPGFILVTVDQQSLKKSVAKTKANVQSWIAANKYIIGVLFMILVVALMVVSEVIK